VSRQDASFIPSANLPDPALSHANEGVAMRWSSISLGSKTACVGVAGVGTGGFVGSLAIMHNSWAAVVAAAVTVTPLIANVAARVAEARYRCRAGILRAAGEAQSACIKASAEAEARMAEARSEADALEKRTELRASLLTSGLDLDKVDQAAIMVLLDIVSSDLPKGRRLNDEPLAGLLAELARLLTDKSPTPSSPGKGPLGRAADQVVVPFPRRVD